MLIYIITFIINNNKEILNEAYYMKKFQDLIYQRPNIKKTTETINKLQKILEEAENVDQQLLCFQRIDTVQDSLATMYSLAYIRHSIDTRDEFYDQEIEFYNENIPLIEEQLDKFYHALLKSPFRAQIEEKYGKYLFELLETKAKTFSPEIVEDLIKENQLTTEYSKLIAAAQVDFDGQTYTLAQLAPFRQSKDRTKRKAATETYFTYYADHEEELDRIYDELVKVRNKMAHTLGYDSFVELGYYRMMRTDYNADDVKKYRDQVYQELVPLVTDLKKRQGKRLGIKNLKYYDEALNFNTGNPLPQGDADWIISRAQTMYEELSPESSEFFNFMLEYNLMDLLAKTGKESGGYCTSLPDYKAPFIFANFNGTQDDVEVMTHEAGHAFQSYQSKDIKPSQYVDPTMESAEIHSMSMEFFTWPWMKLFFGDQTEKFKFSHLSGTLEFIPYGVAVDEYQHWIYENPQATPRQRKETWRKIEKKYQPHLDFDGFEYLENGGKWTRQLHIFTSPFYYIDYTLAQICAFQFWIKDQENHKKAWVDYLKLCQAGGSKPFTGLLKLANLANPFEEGSIAKVIPKLEEFLNSVDDEEL